MSTTQPLNGLQSLQDTRALCSTAAGFAAGSRGPNMGRVARSPHGDRADTADQAAWRIPFTDLSTIFLRGRLCRGAAGRRDPAREAIVEAAQAELTSGP
jgi:hypothetical protein